MIKLYDLVRAYTLTTGTGTLVVGSAVLGFFDFDGGGVQNGETVRYVIRDGANTEAGYGVYTTSGKTLTRNVVKSTAGGTTPITLTGSAVVYIYASAMDVMRKMSKITRPGSQSIPNSSWTSLTFDTKVFDDVGAVDLATHNERMTVPAGVNRARYTLNMIWANNGGGIRYGQITNTNSTWWFPSMMPANNESGATIVTPWMDVSAGEAVYANVIQTSGGNLAIYATLQAEWMY